MLGTLLILSGPSGSGKSTLSRRAEAEHLCKFSVSCTTRSPREGEVDGVDYHFLSQEDFATKVAAGDFLEYATVHANSYGTLRSHVINQLIAGETVVLDIDVQGAALIREVEDSTIRRAYADIFIHLDKAELESRLRGRESDSDEVIALRLSNAAAEEARRHEYQFILNSADREQDYSKFLSLLCSLSMRRQLLA